MPLPGQFAVGQLYRNGYYNGLKVWTQPSGIGGIVYPQMPQFLNGQPAAYPSLYAWGCGHRTNTAEIYEVNDPYANDGAGEQVALVCCPLCLFINQIISPYSAYQDYMETPLVLG